MPSERDERRSEVLATVNDAMRGITDGATTEQLDVVMLAAGFNPKAVRAFARVLLKQESATVDKPPDDLDAGVKWARSHLASAVDDLLAAGGQKARQWVMIAAQSLPSYVAERLAEAKAEKPHERRPKPTPGNGVSASGDAGATTSED